MELKNRSSTYHFLDPFINLDASHSAGEFQLDRLKILQKYGSDLRMAYL